MGSCLACAYSCCCCECNFMVFPAPSPSYKATNSSIHSFTNSGGNLVPYAIMSNNLAPRPSTLNIIYFHGNAQDIGYSLGFVSAIFEYYENKYTGSLINVYCVEYPTYGTYEKSFPARISNGIKDDSLQFFEYLQARDSNVTVDNTVVIGRSIGSGGACYLAANKKINNLILISPFSTIPNVASDFVGCPGKLVKMHFNNLQEIDKYQGELLVIHGKVDQVINYRHGEMVVQAYEKKKNKYHKKCTFISPKDMSHNYFDYDTDILDPICKFIDSNVKL